MNYRSQRYPTDFLVSLVTPSGTIKCKLTNISESGARLEGVLGFEVGESVAFTTAHGRANGIVKWVKGPKLGLEFQPQISLNLVNALRRNGGSMTHNRNSMAGLREM